MQAMLAYLVVRDAIPGHLFILKSRQFLTRGLFSDLVKKTLRSAGIPDKGFTTHSFRIGAATTAKEAGVADMHIKMLGRRKSEAY